MNAKLQLTLRHVRSELRPLGMQIARIDNELRVKHVGQRWSEAYFTNDLADALATGKKISAQIDSEREQTKATAAASRKPIDDKLMTQIKERDARLLRARELSDDRKRASHVFGLSLVSLIGELSVKDALDEQTISEALWDNCADGPYIGAAQRMIALLTKLTEAAPAGETDIERARR